MSSFSKVFVLPQIVHLKQCYATFATNQKLRGFGGTRKNISGISFSTNSIVWGTPTQHNQNLT